MADQANATEKAFALLAQRRQNARVTAQRHQEEIAILIPEIVSLQAELNQTSIRLSKLVLERPDHFSEALNRLRDNNLKTQEEIKRILVEHGYPQDYLSVRYTCQKCGDSGYVNGKRCSCLTALIRKIGAEELNAVTPLKLSGFEQFKLDYYPNTADENGVVPRQQMEKVFSFCIKYARSFSKKSPSLFFVGDTGLGKTHLSLAIAKTVLEKGYAVIYGSAQDLFRSMEKEHFGREKPDKDTLQALLDCDLLVMDDLGAEFDSNYYTTCLYNIVNARLSAGRPTIISSNLTISQVQEKYSERIVSRLFSMYQVLRFSGKDIRQLKRCEW